MHELGKKYTVYIWFVVQVDEVVELHHYLEGQGFDVTNMIGGMLAWEG